MILHYQRVNRVQKVYLSSNETNLISYPGNIHNIRLYISLMLSNAFVASKTYSGSVLFRTSAYTGAKQASRVPTGSKQDSSPHNDDVNDVSVLLESELIGPV